MSDLRKAAEMALKALNNLYLNDYSGYEICKQEAYLVDDAMQALIKALEEPEQEPVAWIKKDRSAIEVSIMSAKYMTNEGFEPLYTAPPKHEWVGLTDDEIQNLEDSWERSDKWATFKEAAREIETKLREKNS